MSILAIVALVVVGLVVLLLVVAFIASYPGKAEREYIQQRQLDKALQNKEAVKNSIQRVANEAAAQLYGVMTVCKLESQIKATVEIEGEFYELTFKKKTNEPSR